MSKASCSVEQSSKDERKKKMENAVVDSQSSLKYSMHGCCFVGQTKAELVNHVRRSAAV